ncbi:MAG: hypothetical protein PHV02_00125 [Rhodocyclaceae bacterium]|nr:hypothetical protein [Rhodocyclaceae bacterium]
MTIAQTSIRKAFIMNSVFKVITLPQTVATLSIAASLLVCVSVSAEPIKWVPVTTGTPSAPMPGGYNQGHQGASGAKYQYDLNNPGDRIRYEVDPAAQLRDQIAVDPRRDIDKSIGQQGGGYYR